MKKIAGILTGLVAALHIYFMILEMFLWQTDFGLKTFSMTAESAAQTSVLAKNQGLYNGILAAGLIWSFFLDNLDFQRMLRIYLLTSIVVAGVFGALTAKPTILLFQALPALLALIAVYFYTLNSRSESKEW